MNDLRHPPPDSRSPRANLTTTKIETFLQIQSHVQLKSPSNPCHSTSESLRITKPQHKTNKPIDIIKWNINNKNKNKNHTPNNAHTNVPSTILRF